MKLSEIRPCDQCGGKLTAGFYVVRFSLGLISPKATNQVLGMAQYFGGIEHIKLAELMSPNPDDAVLITGDEDKSLETELIICQDCIMRHFSGLLVLQEKLAHAKEKSDG